MRGLPQARWAAATVVLALALAACGGSSDNETPNASGDPSASSGGGATAGGDVVTEGTIIIDNGEPQNPLVPVNTNETEGGQIMDAITTGLVNYNPTTAVPENAVAESIETTDSMTYTIKLKSGWTFHDGTPVTAKSFVDAWNWGAYAPNAALNSYFFEPIAGYADVQGEDKNGDEKVTADEAPTTEMSGLKVVDDTTFTVTLGQPESSFPTRLGYTAFVPLPESFFADPKAFGEKPVGNGPFQFVKWDHDVQVDVKAYPDYKGPDPAKVGNITFKVSATNDAAYADLLGNNIDVLDSLPTSALAGDKYKSDLDNRFVDQPEGVFQSITFPRYLPAYADPKVNQAISMAIDRDTIVKTIFNNGRIPANGWVAPVVEGFKEGACGEYCTYDPAKAKAALAAAGGWKGGTMTIGYNADGDHQAWVDAVCNSIKNALAIDCQGKPSPDFAGFRTDIVARKATGAFRTGWQMDYPAIENFLAPIYATGAGSNDGDYTNPAFDAKLKEAAGAEGADALAKYNEAEDILAQDMPVIPLWYAKLQGGYSDKVNPVKFTPFGTVDLSTISLKS